MNRLELNTKINVKTILFSLCIIVLGLIIIVSYKPYAIYKLEKKYDILESKIGTYKNSDVVISALVDGEETNTFPTYETNYKVSSIECSNGVVGEWDTTNWRLIIDDMSSTSTKCTVNFDSTKTNEETPVAYSKSDLIALNEEITNTTYEKLKTKLLDDTYPVGSIYISTTDDTIDKVKERFGGTWVKYSEGTTLVGANASYAVNSTGGSSTVSLNAANLPNHTHTTKSASLQNGVTSSNGSHSHNGTFAGTNIKIIYADNNNVSTNDVWGFIDMSKVYLTKYHSILTMGASGEHTHSVTGTIPSLSTESCSNCSSTAFSVQNPYTSVYMYKRTA